MGFIHWLITTFILACLFVWMKGMVSEGHYWLFVAGPVAAVALGYVVGGPEDRADYHNIWRWITDRLAGQRPASSTEQDAEQNLPALPSAAASRPDVAHRIEDRE